MVLFYTGVGRWGASRGQSRWADRSGLERIYLIEEIVIILPSFAYIAKKAMAEVVPFVSL